MPVYAICYAASMLLASGGHYTPSGLCLLFAAAYLYLTDVYQSRNTLELRALFSLFWVGGQGLSCLKLSGLQSSWTMMTWACLFAALAGFRVTCFFLDRRGSGRRGGEVPEARTAGIVRILPAYRRGIRFAIVLLTAASLAAFCAEAAILGYVPLLLRGVPHAYSYFHITGLHYITVSCVLVPSMTVLLYFTQPEDADEPGNRRREWPGKDSKTEREKNHAESCKIADRNKSSRFQPFLRFLRDCPVSCGCCLLALAIPLLCVSRFQLIFAVLLAVLTYMNVSGRKRLRYLVGAVLALIPFYLILTVARSHDVAYLNGIFEMKNADTPIFITQPYMYIAHNYDNFNCLTEQLPSHTYGLKGLFPLWALTGLKFLKPELFTWPIYTTKAELTTVTLFYDAYYDFGMAGVIFFSCALGVFAHILSDMQNRGRNPAWQLLYAQAAAYFMLSFFTTWYSNPTTWFYFAVTGAFAVLTELMNKGEKRLWYQKK